MCSRVQHSVIFPQVDVNLYHRWWFAQTGENFNIWVVNKDIYMYRIRDIYLYQVSPSASLSVSLMQPSSSSHAWIWASLVTQLVDSTVVVPALQPRVWISTGHWWKQGMTCWAWWNNFLHMLSTMVGFPLHHWVRSARCMLNWSVFFFLLNSTLMNIPDDHSSMQNLIWVVCSVALAWLGHF